MHVKFNFDPCNVSCFLGKKAKMNRIILVMGMKQTDRQTDRRMDRRVDRSVHTLVVEGMTRLKLKQKETKIDQYRTGPSARRWGINETSVCRQNVGELAEGLSWRAVLH